MTPEEEEQQRKTAALNASAGSAPAPGAPQAPASPQAQALNASAGAPADSGVKPGGTSFGLTPEQFAALRKSQEAQIEANHSRVPLEPKAIRNPTDNPDLDPNASIIAGTSAALVDRAADTALLDAQSQNANVQRTDQWGAPDILGHRNQYSNYTAGPVSTTALDTTAGRADALAASIGSRPIVQAKGATIDTTAANEGRGAAFDTAGRQRGLADILTASALGNGPSAAQLQLQRATDTATSKAAALAASGRGVNPALMARQAAEGAAASNQEAVGQSAILRAQEQQQAQGALGAALGTQRGQDLQSQQQDLGAATAQAGLEQGASLANAQLTVDQQKEQDAMQAQLLAQVQAGQITQIQAKQQLATFNADLQARQEAARNQQNLTQAQNTQAAIGTGIATAGAIAATAMSDKRAKKNIDDGEEETRAFLKVLRPKGFDYKDPANGEGRHIGVMAQDVERGAPDIIVEEGGFKKLDIRKALSASLASLGSIDKRLSRMEKGRG